MSIFQQHRWSLIAISSVLSLYLIAFNLIPLSVFWSPDEGAKFIQLQTLGWADGLGYQLPYPGQRLDPAYRFYPQHQPHYPIYPKPLAEGQARFHWPLWFPLISIVPFKLRDALISEYLQLVEGQRADVSPVQLVFIGAAQGRRLAYEKLNAG